MREREGDGGGLDGEKRSGMKGFRRRGRADEGERERETRRRRLGLDKE